MADRLLVFANPEVQKLLKEKFITVAADDWYSRSRKDKVGEFFRKVARQGPRDPERTQQGHYVLTAQGKLLGYNNNRGAERRLAMMKESLEKWESLPESEKGSSIPDEGGKDQRYHHELPEGAQVVKIFTRALEEREGRLRKLANGKVGNQSAVDHLWLRSSELAELRKLIVTGGGEFPGWFSMRVARLHLRDNTRGEPRVWRKEEIKEWQVSIDQKGVVSGNFLIDSPDGKLGYQGKVQGLLEFGDEGRLKRFDWLVIGKQWGSGPHTRGARPGKTPLGQVFQLSDGSLVRDRIPPQGMRWAPGYWGAQK